jgi:environmental stress-induced protein Ves
MNRIQRDHEHQSMPWANGGGVTYQIASWPPGADLSGFDWRISMADVSEPGPFSHFPGIDRVLTVLGPGPMALTINASTALVTPNVPIEFSGDDTVTAELPEGPIRDLNVMTRRGVCTSTVRVVELRQSHAFSPDGHATIVVVLGGGLTTSAREDLAPRDVLFVDESVTVSGEATVAVIQIHGFTG